MSRYADALLRLAHRFALRRPAPATEVFTVGTRLTRVTRAMRLRDVERALVAAGETVPTGPAAPGSGRRCEVFLDRWGQRGLARGAVVVIFSDGWERGDAALLGEQMARLHRLAHRVVWVNPHEGKAGYQPVQRGWRPRCRTSTTSWPATRWPPFEELLEVIARCVRCCEQLRRLVAGGRAGRDGARWWRRSARRPGRPGRRCWSARTAGGRLGLRRLRRGRGLRARPGRWSPTAAPVLQRYGVSDDDAFAVGLTCGGILDVFVERVDRETFPELGEIADDIEPRTGRSRSRRVVDHPDPRAVGAPAASCARRGRGDARALRAASAASGSTPRWPTTPAGCSPPATAGCCTYGPDGERRGEGMRVFVWAFAPPPRMLVFGAIDFAAAVARIGGFLGYHVTVCDARPVFATALALPRGRRGRRRSGRTGTSRPRRDAGRIDGRTVLCVLTHDPKFDVPLLEVALRLPEVGYVGAMGSRRTHEDRLARLARGGADRGRAGAAVRRRSGSTSAPAPRRRPRSASPPRSSRCGGAGAASGSPSSTDRIHH